MLNEVPQPLVNHFCYIARNTGRRFTQLFQTITTGYANVLIIDHISQKIIRICSNTTVNGVLRTLRSAFVTDWIENAYIESGLDKDEVPDDLIRDLDQIVDSLYSLLTDVEQQLKTIGFTQQREMRADLISDMFSVVVRDVKGRLFEISRRWFKNVNHIRVLEAVRARIESPIAIPMYHVLNELRLLLRTAHQTLPNVLDMFVIVYRDVSTVYILQSERILDYLIEKQMRNINSHFEDSINEYAELNPIGNNQIPATYFNNFIDRYGPAREVFFNNETNQLHAVLGQFCLQRPQPPNQRYTIFR